jgi:hypothetical protein
VAIYEAIQRGDFKDPKRMVKFQLVFAHRYFTALNAYNDHLGFKMPTHVWKQSFETNALNEPIVFQHLLTGLNAHMNLDLGIAAATAGRGDMASLRTDFNLVNTILGYQVESVLEAIAEMSPFIKRMLDCIRGEVAMFRALIVVFREIAWRFALDLAEKDEQDLKAQIDLHDAKYDDLGMKYLYAPPKFDFLIERIAAEERREVDENIELLYRSSAPAGPEQIVSYEKCLEEAAAKRDFPMTDDNSFFERCADDLRDKARGFLDRVGL